VRKMLLAGTTALIFGMSAPGAQARGGTGNLSPLASPYAILEPQTVPQAAIPTEADETNPAEAARSYVRKRQRAPKPAQRPL
jgi:hypothetical protein